MNTHRDAFTYKPKGPLSDVFVSPTHTKALWDVLWSKARRQDWWQEDVGYVGNKNGYFYFQKPGLTTGFARVRLEG